MSRGLVSVACIALTRIVKSHGGGFYKIIRTDNVFVTRMVPFWVHGTGVGVVQFPGVCGYGVVPFPGVCGYGIVDIVDDADVIQCFCSGH
jgi:hypothetical protein